MEPITLKSYLIAKGYKLSWVSTQIGMNYHAFWQFLHKDASLSEINAKNLELLTQGDWKAIKEDGRERWKMELNI